MQSTTTSKKPQAPPKPIHGKVRTPSPPNNQPQRPALMSYLKIYPKSIVAPQTVAGVFEGMLTLEMEQYGLQLIPMNCAVTISAEDAWHIEIQPISGIETLLFNQFTQCLNEYLFGVLKASPSSQTDDWLVFKFYFDEIYIDLTGQEPVVYKIPSKSD